MTKEEKIKKELAALGSEKLAEVLSDLADRSDKASNMVFQLLSSKKEKLKRFNAKLAGIKRRKSFISWREASAFAYNLQYLLQDLRNAVDDPKKGVECVIKFYEADESVFECCDDSGGTVGTVFTCDALNLFVFYASKCKDKEWIAAEVERLILDDDYGVRENLINRVGEYLPDKILRVMIDRFMRQASGSDEWEKGSWIRMAEDIAAQLKDVELYEKTASARNGVLSNHNHLDIAKIYFSKGDFESALKHLKLISSTVNMYDYDELLLETYRKLGNQSEIVKIFRKNFDAHPSLKSLETLLKEIGEDRRDELLKETKQRIIGKPHFSENSAEFLIDVGMEAEAESYILSRKEQIDGESYYSLPSIAKKLIKSNRYLPAVVIYRALLEANTAKAQSKYYNHGIRYLKELEKISPEVTDWKNIIPHSDYFTKFREIHARKTAFWKKYGESV